MIRFGVHRSFLSMMLVGIFAVAVLPAVAQEKSTAAQDFLAQLDARFDTWDRDHDGVLSAREIDSVVADPKTVGAEAATIAALKRGMSGKKYHTPPLTKPIIQERTGTTLAADQPDFAKIYTAIRAKLSKSNNVLFAMGAPKLDSVRQGRLGDCFCLAPLGAMLARDPQEVTRLFERQSDGTYTVRFGKQTVSITPPTDAEIALTSSTDQSGMWVNLYEKAVGTSRLKPEAETGKSAITSPFDAVARGGSAGTMLSLLTGHPITRFSCRFAQSSSITNEERAEKMNSLRKQLSAAVKERRLITCGTNKPKTPGITPNHAYAILSYDDATDTIRLWNPHGDSFTPKGTPGLANGYPRTAGVFSMPLVDFVDQFAGVAFENASGPEVKPTS